MTMVKSGFKEVKGYPGLPQILKTKIPDFSRPKCKLCMTKIGRIQDLKKGGVGQRVLFGQFR